MEVYSEIVCDSVFEDACLQLCKTLVHRVNDIDNKNLVC